MKHRVSIVCSAGTRFCLHALGGLFFALLAACATTPPPTPVSHAYFAELGEVDGGLLAGAVDRVLVETHDFAVAREDEQYATVYYETEWKERDPFPSERAVDANRARTRVILRGLRASGGAYRAVLEGENQIRTDSLPDWHTAPLTVDFRQWMADIEGDLRGHLGLR